MLHSSAVTLKSHTCKMQKYFCKTSINPNCWYLRRKKSPSRMETYQCEWHYRNLSEYVLVWLPACTDTHTEIIDTICSVADVLLRGTEIKPWLGTSTFPPPQASLLFTYLFWENAGLLPQMGHNCCTCILCNSLIMCAYYNSLVTV